MTLSPLAEHILVKAVNGNREISITSTLSGNNIMIGGTEELLPSRKNVQIEQNYEYTFNKLESLGFIGDRKVPNDWTITYRVTNTAIDFVNKQLSKQC